MLYTHDIKSRNGAECRLVNGIAVFQALGRKLLVGKKKIYNNFKKLAERGFDPRTSGLWAQHASTAPFCYFYINIKIWLLKLN